MYQPSDFLTRDATMFPDRRALAAQETELTYAQLDAAAGKVAGSLRERGVTPGVKVAYLLDNGTASVVLFQALMKLGAVAVPLNKRLLADDVAYMVESVDVRVLIFDSNVEGVVAEAVESCKFSGLLVACGDTTVLSALSWNELESSSDDGRARFEGYASPNEDALIMFTSGTTGRPKAVVRTAEMVSMLSAVQLVEGHSHESETVALYTQAPLYHMGGFLAMLKTIATGGTLVIESHFDPATVFNLIERYSVNQLYMIPPTLFSRLYDAESRAGRSFPSVFEAQCAGGRAHERDRDAAFSLFPHARIRTSFGSSETGMICTSYFSKSQCEERPMRASTVGTANAFVAIKLVDEHGNPVPDGQPGEALVKSPQVFAGYAGLPIETARVFDEDGFFRTGDVLYLDEEGLYVFVDRMKDMIKTGGENVYAIEVERVVQQFPGVEDCAVIGVDDDRYGESIAAAIVLTPEAAERFSPGTLIEFCKARMASYKKPRYLAILDEIPRNSLGKIQKNELRARQDEFEPIAL